MSRIYTYYYLIMALAMIEPVGIWLWFSRGKSARMKALPYLFLWEVFALVYYLVRPVMIPFFRWFYRDMPFFPIFLLRLVIMYLLSCKWKRYVPIDWLEWSRVGVLVVCFIVAILWRDNDILSAFTQIIGLLAWGTLLGRSRFSWGASSGVTDHYVSSGMGFGKPTAGGYDSTPQQEGSLRTDYEAKAQEWHERQESTDPLNHDASYRPSENDLKDAGL